MSVKIFISLFQDHLSESEILFLQTPDEVQLRQLLAISYVNLAMIEQQQENDKAVGLLYEKILQLFDKVPFDAQDSILMRDIP